MTGSGLSGRPLGTVASGKSAQRLNRYWTVGQAVAGVPSRTEKGAPSRAFSYSEAGFEPATFGMKPKSQPATSVTLSAGASCPVGRKITRAAAGRRGRSCRSGHRAGGLTS